MAGLRFITSKQIVIYWCIFICAVVLTSGIAAILVKMSERKQEARQSMPRMVEIEPDEPDSSVWGKNFPRQLEMLSMTEKDSGRTKYGGSERFQRLDENPRLKRLFAGYAFSIDYKEDRGHFHALEDAIETKRLAGKKPGTCMTCKGSQIPRLMRLSGGHAEFYKTPFDELLKKIKGKPTGIGCADCHDSKTMELKITRPAFKEAMEARGIDLSKATRQEMRSYVCGQCHAEYYFKGDGKYLVFPWEKGLTIDDIEAYYDEAGFKDWVHPDSKAEIVKMQHPEFELWSTGIHSRANVSCADCHMPYKREGGLKVSDHWVKSPLKSINQSCQTCHRAPEAELKARVELIQDRTAKLMKEAELAIIDAIDAIKEAETKGASQEELKMAKALHRRSHIRWDFISAENSMGFHSPQETARILGEAIDFARQAQVAAIKISITND